MECPGIWCVFADAPNLDKVARNGVKAEYLKTVVPSKAWPTHHSFFTGLYPESHGIVSNRFWDPVYQEEFIYEYDCANFDPKFYNDSEPIWLTLQRSKVNKDRSGVYFWPGFGRYTEMPSFYRKPVCKLKCSAVDPKELPRLRNITRSVYPPYLDFFSKDEEFPKRVDRIKSLTILRVSLHFISTNLIGKDIQMEGFRQLTRIPLRRLMKML